MTILLRSEKKPRTNIFLNKNRLLTTQRAKKINWRQSNTFIFSNTLPIDINSLKGSRPERNRLFSTNVYETFGKIKAFNTPLGSENFIILKNDKVFLKKEKLLIKKNIKVGNVNRLNLIRKIITENIQSGSVIGRSLEKPLKSTGELFYFQNLKLKSFSFENKNTTNPVNKKIRQIKMDYPLRPRSGLPFKGEKNQVPFVNNHISIKKYKKNLKNLFFLNSAGTLSFKDSFQILTKSKTSMPEGLISPKRAWSNTYSEHKAEPIVLKDKGQRVRTKTIFENTYSKLTEINLITISLASANRIRQWAEKTLPNGKVVGEVINPETVHYKTLKPIKGGLFCERIFGPLKDHECACGKKFNIKNYLTESSAENLTLSGNNTQIVKSPVTTKAMQKRYFCRVCDVEYTYSIIRRTQLGYIQLASPTTHVWFVKGIPSYISILLDMKKKHLQNVTYNTDTLTLEHSLRGRQYLPSSPKSIFESWQKIMKKQYPDKYNKSSGEDLPFPGNNISNPKGVILKQPVKIKKIKKNKNTLRALNIGSHNFVDSNNLFRGPLHSQAAKGSKEALQANYLKDLYFQNKKFYYCKKKKAQTLSASFSQQYSNNQKKIKNIFYPSGQKGEFEYLQSSVGTDNWRSPSGIWGSKKRFGPEGYLKYTSFLEKIFKQIKLQRSKLQGLSLKIQHKIHSSNDGILQTIFKKAYAYKVEFLLPEGEQSYSLEAEQKKIKKYNLLVRIKTKKNWFKFVSTSLILGQIFNNNNNNTFYQIYFFEKIKIKNKKLPLSLYLLVKTYKKHKLIKKSEKRINLKIDGNTVYPYFFDVPLKGNLLFSSNAQRASKPLTKRFFDCQILSSVDTTILKSINKSILDNLSSAQYYSKFLLNYSFLKLEKIDKKVFKTFKTILKDHQSASGIWPSTHTVTQKKIKRPEEEFIERGGKLGLAEKMNLWLIELLSSNHAHKASNNSFFKKPGGKLLNGDKNISQLKILTRVYNNNYKALYFFEKYTTKLALMFLCHLTNSQNNLIKRKKAFLSGLKYNSFNNKLKIKILQKLYTFYIINNFISQAPRIKKTTRVYIDKLKKTKYSKKHTEKKFKTILIKMGEKYNLIKTSKVITSYYFFLKEQKKQIVYKLYNSLMTDFNLYSSKHLQSSVGTDNWRSPSGIWPSSSLARCSIGGSIRGLDFFKRCQKASSVDTGFLCYTQKTMFFKTRFPSSQFLKILLAPLKTSILKSKAISPEGETQDSRDTNKKIDQKNFKINLFILKTFFSYYNMTKKLLKVVKPFSLSLIEFVSLYQRLMFQTTPRWTPVTLPTTLIHNQYLFKNLVLVISNKIFKQVKILNSTLHNLWIILSMNQLYNMDYTYLLEDNKDISHFKLPYGASLKNLGRFIKNQKSGQAFAKYDQALWRETPLEDPLMPGGELKDNQSSNGAVSTIRGTRLIKNLNLLSPSGICRSSSLARCSIGGSSGGQRIWRSNLNHTLVNNIYCLSHRELWEQEKDWQDFAYYYYSPTTLLDKPIPLYKYRNYDLLFSIDNTLAYNTDFSARTKGTLHNQLYNLGMNINTVFSGAGLIQTLLNEYNYTELKKMDKQNRILLFEYNKQIKKLKKAINETSTIKSNLQIGQGARSSGGNLKLQTVKQQAQAGFIIKKTPKRSRGKVLTSSKYYKACHIRDVLIRRTKLTRKIFNKILPTESEVLGKNYNIFEVSDNSDFVKSSTSNGLNMILTLLPVLPPVLRPVLKMSGQFTISDLNRLYQRIIYRNERLKKFLKDPALSSSFEMKYAQRLLQEAVDNLIQNGKSGVVPEKDARGRLLKSLSDILKGKQGRFRQYLLGKRVDYSGRSVIVVGPRLKLHECGIPKEMALVLYSPFLIKRILNEKLADTYLSAKKLIKTNPLLVSQLLREIMQACPVLLNRAPTLHRLGFQAFIPKLVDGKAILLHPLVCPAFNADFDGDQMAVHVPITFEARAEAWKLMLARNNLLSPATGEPLILPSQDMVLGCYYLTTNCAEKWNKFKKGTGMFFHTITDVLKAYNQQLIHVHAVIWVNITGHIENGNIVEQPLELRLSLNKFKLNNNISASVIGLKTAYTDYIEIYSKAHNIRRLDGNLQTLIIRTTPGKIFFNILIKKTLEKRPNLLSKYNYEAGFIKNQLLNTFDLQIENFKIK